MGIVSNTKQNPKENPKLKAGSKMFYASLFLVLINIAFLGAQNCDVLPSESDFNFEVLVEPASGNAYDIDVSQDLKVYWIERYGKIYVYDQETSEKSEVYDTKASYDGAGWERGNEGGGQGLALDLNFSETRWIYIYYSLPTSITGNPSPGQLGPTERLARFTLDEAGTSVVPNSEKVIFEHKIWAQCCHQGGDLNMDKQGNLWLSTGDNLNPGNTNGNPLDASAPQKDVRSTAGNTNDLRGKILRIKPILFADSETPEAGLGTTYEIPEGNLFPEADDAGNKTLPEIYTMGHRNPFTFSINEENGWVVIGEASGAAGQDEINLAKTPGFYGWPFFSGENVKYQEGNAGQAGDAFNVSSPENNSPHNTGLDRLTPALPALLTPNTSPSLGMACMGVVGPWIIFDEFLDSDVKWPPSTHNTFIGTSYGNGVPYNIISLTENGSIDEIKSIGNAGGILGESHRLTQGPDGAVYVTKGQYTFGTAPNSKIVKISYTGDCSYITPIAEKPFSESELSQMQTKVFHFNTEGILNLPNGSQGIILHDLKGKKVWTKDYPKLSEGEVTKLPSHLKQGIYYATFR